MIKKEIAKLIEDSLKRLQKSKKLSKFVIPEIIVEKPEQKVHGDYSSNIALEVAKLAKKNPKELADLIKGEIKSKIFEKIEIAGPGFINFFLSEEYLQKVIGEILSKKEKFGQLNLGKSKKVQVEFISANPTGPLTLGNARGGFCGDVLTNVFKKAGYKASREYYVNDIGSQVWEKLKLSLEGKEGGYKGPHIDELRKRKVKDPQEATKIILKEWIKPTIEKMGIKFDKYVLESKLEKERKDVKVLLKKKKLSYEKEGALWFKSTKFGDDKDRVLKKADGKQTYILSDIAYLKNKFGRGFDKLVYFLGAEHHGYIPRLKAGAEALGYKKEQVEAIVFQLVKLLKDGKEVRMSKRKGIYITIDDLLKEINIDVARYFFLTRGYGNHLLFDLNLAKEQSEKNPIYYIQYAHARICSILGKIKGSKIGVKNLGLLKHPSELNLIKQLIIFPEIIEDTAKDYQVQRIPRYAHSLAEAFHRFYRDCKVIADDKKLEESRLALISATKIVLKETLDLMGISAPQKM